MGKNFNIGEILESVDVIVTGNSYTKQNKNKIINRYKSFINKKINMADNPETEKIINDAENSLDKKEDQGIEINSIELERPKNEEISEKLDRKAALENLSSEEKRNTLVLSDVAPLLLTEEYTEEENIYEDDNFKEDNYFENEVNENLKETNSVLNSENLDQKEKIKDLNILIDSFISQKRYTDLDSKIKLYQDDNAALRKKIFDLSDKETSLRLQLAEMDMNQNIEKEKNENFEQSVEAENKNTEALTNEILILKEENTKLKEFEQSIEDENKNTEALTNEILILKEENIKLKEELLTFKKEKDSYAHSIDDKIKFYREENAKIIIDKSDIEKKLDNTRSQLAINENNKQELKIALDNLNQILATSNIESSTFINKIEEQANNTNPIVSQNTSKRYKKIKSRTLLDEDSLDLLVKEIFTK